VRTGEEPAAPSSAPTSRWPSGSVSCSAVRQGKAAAAVAGARDPAPTLRQPSHRPRRAQSPRPTLRLRPQLARQLTRQLEPAADSTDGNRLPGSRLSSSRRRGRRPRGGCPRGRHRGRNRRGDAAEPEPAEPEPAETVATEAGATAPPTSSRPTAPVVPDWSAVRLVAPPYQFALRRPHITE
jgi:hypothetical protein